MRARCNLQHVIVLRTSKPARQQTHGAAQIRRAYTWSEWSVHGAPRFSPYRPRVAHSPNAERRTPNAERPHLRFQLGKCNCFFLDSSKGGT
jgi:hypothetical protein